MDAGTTTCGIGENALHVALLGLSVLGVDVAETALAIARKKADDRGVEIEFAAADAFHLERLGRMSKTVLDCGLFHSFTGDERPGYVTSLASVTEHDGTRAFTLGGIPIFGRKIDLPEKRRWLDKLKAYLGLAGLVLPNKSHRARQFFRSLRVDNREILSPHDFFPKLHFASMCVYRGRSRFFSEG